MMDATLGYLAFALTIFMILIMTFGTYATIRGLINAVFGDRWVVFTYDRDYTMVLMENTYTPSSSHVFKYQADRRAKWIEKKGGFAIVSRNLRALVTDKINSWE